MESLVSNGQHRPVAGSWVCMTAKILLSLEIPASPFTFKVCTRTNPTLGSYPVSFSCFLVRCWVRPPDWTQQHHMQYQPVWYTVWAQSSWPFWHRVWEGLTLLVPSRSGLRMIPWRFPMCSLQSEVGPLWEEKHKISRKYQEWFREG